MLGTPMEERRFSEMDLCPSPALVRAPDGGVGMFPDPSVSGSGAWIVTKDLFFFLFNRVREFARECAALPLLERIPPGEGRDAMCDMEAEVCSSEVDGSK